ncbi:integrase [Massilia sp. MP_M2]|uniref:site-specific integrase n=1 Tax=Massilia sp. MP_M2 TaxID=3071713 RepID=UPI00319E022A
MAQKIDLEIFTRIAKGKPSRVDEYGNLNGSSGIDSIDQYPPSALVEIYSKAAQSVSTTRSYDSDIRHFLANGGSIPASPERIAEYLAEFSSVHSVATLKHRLVAIHRAHIDAELPSPTSANLVKRTMQGIRRTMSIKQRRVTALLKDDLLEMVVHIERQQPIRAARDKALLLIGFAGAFRRSELVALNFEDITKYENGIELAIRRSKTDQEGAGRTAFIPYARGKRCPAQALLLWLEISGIAAGALFPRISRADRIIGTNSLTPQSVALLVKSYFLEMRGAVSAANVAGHSLRAGYCTEAAVAGIPLYQIREQTGHRSDATLARYIRPANKRKIPSLF